jgi:excisionase family DNA binding protein
VRALILRKRDWRSWATVASPHGGSELTQGGSYRLLTPTEVAEWLQVSELTIKNKYRAWGLKPQKVGRLLRFRERDVIAYLESNYG